MNRPLPIILVILDGFGYRKERKYNAIAQAHTPNLDAWFSKYPFTYLKASGPYVGLPEGYMGNSEVGHMTIGAGYVSEEIVTRINKAIDDGSFFANTKMLDLFAKCRAASGRLHIIGLLSDAGVHGHIEHLLAYIKAAQNYGITQIYVHLILDGRDMLPYSAKSSIEKIEQALGSRGTLASLQGRFYAMDRNNNWDRTLASYTMLTNPEKEKNSVSWRVYLAREYAQGRSDEFVEPILLNGQGAIKDGDTALFTNFRPDRMRQLTSCFVQPDHLHVSHGVALAACGTAVRYASFCPSVDLFDEKLPLEVTLANILAQHNKRLFAVAETEKYAPITYFFKGGREEVLPTEKQVLIESVSFKNYAALPCMQAPRITQAVQESLDTDLHSVYLINYANADMVAHSGNFEATIKAIECLDKELGILYASLALYPHALMIITADHGNAECMFDEAHNQPSTSHTTNLVPFLVLSSKQAIRNQVMHMTQLADIAPFILTQLDIGIPEIMKKKL